MKKTYYFFLFLFLLTGQEKLFSQDELSVSMMKQVTTEILNLFLESKPEQKLKQFISDEWVEDNRIKLKNFKINYYSPEEFAVVTASGNISVAVIGGKTWKHILIFKFVTERGKYKIIPKGISKVTGEYIDPWWDVSEYICDSVTDK